MNACAVGGPAVLASLTCLSLLLSERQANSEQHVVAIGNVTIKQHLFLTARDGVECNYRNITVIPRCDTDI